MNKRLMRDRRKNQSKTERENIKQMSLSVSRGKSKHLFCTYLCHCYKDERLRSASTWIREKPITTK